MDKLHTRTRDTNAARLIQQAAREWTWTVNRDADMLEGHKRDRADLRNVATVLRTGKRYDAWCAAQHLDTIVRECIPEVAWNYLSSTEPSYDDYCEFDSLDVKS